jgi:hypothetical protein
MPQHRALTIPEIISEILKNAMYKYCPPYNSNLDEWKKSRADLLSAALCCTAFKEPSLDLLWNTMSTILLLLRLIPGMAEIDGQMVSSCSLIV